MEFYKIKIGKKNLVKKCLDCQSVLKSSFSFPKNIAINIFANLWKPLSKLARSESLLMLNHERSKQKWIPRNCAPGSLSLHVRIRDF
jgi:hypothetical protein